MKTAFREVELDQIRYSLVWEDYRILRKGLEPAEGDVLGIITSAGCNVLQAALEPFREIVAIDINPVQILLLRLKMHLIERFPYEVFEDLLGFRGIDRVRERMDEIASLLPGEFAPLLPQLREWGMLQCGRLERYMLGFLNQYPEPEKGIRQLFACNNLQERRHFLNTWNDLPEFKAAFCEYYNVKNLSRGRDPRLFRYTHEEAGNVFYHRFLGFLNQHEGPLPFVFRFFFFGTADCPMELRPAAYRKENFFALRKNLHKIRCVQSEIFEYLQLSGHTGINKLALSNIFEYCPPEEFREQHHWLMNHLPKGSRFLFWNLLQHQHEIRGLQAIDSERMSLEESCFYFLNLKLYAT